MLSVDYCSCWAVAVRKTPESWLDTNYAAWPGFESLALWNCAAVLMYSLSNRFTRPRF